MWWMPWVFVPIKEVQDCFKLRGAVKKRYYSEISEWGNLIYRKIRSLITKTFAFAEI
jgi:hypothetical protein